MKGFSAFIKIILNFLLKFFISLQVLQARPNNCSNQHNPKEKRRQSAPPKLKETELTTTHKNKTKLDTDRSKKQQQQQAKEQITAISRLETSSKDAPLIHIIQELHNNCVISEVRVNKYKIESQQANRCNTKVQNSIRKPQISTEKSTSKKMPEPTAPPIDDKMYDFEYINEHFAYSTSPLNSSEGKSTRKRHKAGGRLLQKRLSHSPIQYKPRNLGNPPPKPPRSSSSQEDKTSISTLNSSSPSVKEAEKILDDFLRKKGYEVPGEKQLKHKEAKSTQTHAEILTEKPKKPTQTQANRRNNRKSYPMSEFFKVFTRRI